MSASPTPPDRAEGSYWERAEGALAGPREIAYVRAPNPGPLSLSGTNTWVVGRSPAWIVDPGPRIESHLQRLSAAIEARGGLGGVAVTHDHSDHSEGVVALLERHPAPLATARGKADVRLVDDARFGPFQAIPTPGHAPDHFALIAEGACFTGDAVLGAGSVFISPHKGAMSAYLHALRRLRAREDFDVLCPGHGPPVWDARAKLDEYIAHRLERESALLAALKQGRRSVAELLDTAWSDVPEGLRPVAAITLAAHLDKLEEEGRLPPGVERPSFAGGEL